jgi:hypothetical protein
MQSSFTLYVADVQVRALQQGIKHPEDVAKAWPFTLPTLSVMTNLSLSKAALHLEQSNGNDTNFAKTLLFR